MRNTELPIVLLAVLAVTAIVLWVRYRQDRLKVIERALSTPELDPAARRALVDELAGRNRWFAHWRANAWEQLTLIGRNGVFVLGWIALFVGVGCAIAGLLSWDDDLVAGGAIAAVAGLGVATVPLALRELRSRSL